jgi:hypothetical protein
MLKLASLQILNLLMQLLQITFHDDDLAVLSGVHTGVTFIEGLAIGASGFLTRTLDFGKLATRACVVGTPVDL